MNIFTRKKHAVMACFFFDHYGMGKHTSTINKLLSYLLEIPLEKRSSPMNPSMEVVLSQGRVKLNSANATYSFEDKYQCFRKAFEEIDIGRYKIDRTLILGYGLGSIPVMLNRLFDIQCSYDAIDIDPVIIALAKKYGPGGEVGQITYHCMDALEFINKADEQYDLITIDLFEDDKVPEAIERHETLNEIDRLLATGGILLFNRLKHRPDLKTATEKYLNGVFRQKFPGATTIDTGGNLVLFYRKGI